MATVREAIDAIDDPMAMCTESVYLDAICAALNIPPDTENTPHAIAAAVLGIDEDTLRRALLVAERVEAAGAMEWRPFARIAAGPDMDEFDSTHLAQANGAEALLIWLTRPDERTP